MYVCIYVCMYLSSVCVCVCVCVCATQVRGVEARRPPMGISSFPPCESQRLNSGNLVWWQAALSVESLASLRTVFYMHTDMFVGDRKHRAHSKDRSGSYVTGGRLFPSLCPFDFWEEDWTKGLVWMERKTKWEADANDFLNSSFASLFCFIWGRVFQCSPGCPGTGSVAWSGPKLRGLLTSLPQGLRFMASSTTSRP